MKKTCSLAAVVAAFLVGSAQAGPVLWINDNQGWLGTVDVATGTVTMVGNTGVILTDIGFDSSGNLYGVNFNNFYSINKTTAATSLVGSLGINDANALVFSNSGVAYTMGFTGTDLYTVNTGTGAATSIGDVGFTSGGDLAFHGGDFYLASGSSHLIDVALSPSVGGSDVGAFGVSNVYGLANGDDGILYAVAGTKIYTVDTSTGAATFVLDYSGHGLGSANGQSFYAEAVPEPGAWLMLGIGALAAWPVVRRRRAA